MKAEDKAAATEPKDCPTPEYHDTHRYCPSCTFTYEEPSKAGREGDAQPMPVKNDQPFVQDAVIDDLITRKVIGIQRYGTPLQINNGRDMLVDAYEEAMDLCVYLKGAIMERDSKAVATETPA